MEILAFGIVKEIFNGSAIEVDINDGMTISGLKKILEEKYPRLRQLGSYMIAVNNEYALQDDGIFPGNEVAIIPPVSGG